MPDSDADGVEFSLVSGAMFELVLAMDEMRGVLGERLGTGVTGLKTLSILNRLGPSPAGALAVATGITSGSMTATLDKLVENGYIERRASPADGRHVVVVITAEGKRAVDWVITHYWAPVAAAIPDEEHAAIIGGFLTGAAENLRGAAETLPPHRA